MGTEPDNISGRFNFDANEFEAYLSGIIHEWLKTLTALAIAFVPTFFILDYFTMPQGLLTRFGIYRLVSTIVIVVQYFIIRGTKPSYSSYYHGYFVSINIGGIIALMTVDLGGFNSSYYAGLNLVIMGVNLFLPWKALHSAVNSIIIISMYILFNLAANQNYDVTILINHLFFLFSTAIIAVSINHLRYHLVRKEFFLLVELKKARDALWSEMELAKRIQTALLPGKKKIKGFEVAAAMVPAIEVGGDYYDIIVSPSGDRWITIGDVSGHGFDSGLLMMMAQTSILSIVNNHKDCLPSALLGAANTVMRENIARLGSDHYMTMMAIRFDDSRMTVAGKHQDILVYRALSNKTEVIPTKGTWLGITDNIGEYLEDISIDLKEGDILLLFTDGIVEATNKYGEMYRQVRLEQMLTLYADLPADSLVDKIIGEVGNFQAEQLDDMTLVVVKKCSSTE